jgi:hypothetical protein
MPSLGVLAIGELTARPAKRSMYAHREGRLTLKVTGAPTRCSPKIKPCTGASG